MYVIVLVRSCFYFSVFTSLRGKKREARDNNVMNIIKIAVIYFKM